MSILNVNTIQPVGSGQTITVSAADISAPSTVVTASSFVGNVNATGVSTFSDTVNVGAGKSIRIYGSTSGYSDIIASSAAGASELLLPNTSGTLDRLNRAGNILQVVTASYATQFTTSSTSYVDTGFDISITPTNASSKLLIIATGTMAVEGTTSVGSLAITDSSNTILSECVSFIRTLTTTGGTAIGSPPYAMQAYVDAVDTASRTYKLRAKKSGTTSAGIYGSGAGDFITIMEIAQ